MPHHTKSESGRSQLTRREFIGTTSMAVAGLSLAASTGCTPSSSSYDPKDLPTRRYGKFGFAAPLLSFGLGNRWMETDEDTALEALEYAFNQGVFYWDTAPTYSLDKKEYSEIRVGKILPERRDKVFLVTKIQDRDPEIAKRTIETSLKRLNTDHINLLHIHAIKDMEDAKGIGSILELLEQYKSEGIIKHIGFTGHAHAAAMKWIAENHDLEAMMIAMNHADQMEWANVKDNNFEDLAVPYAANKEMAVIAMKVIRPRETVKELTVEQLIRYALSFEELSTAVIGMKDKREVEENLSIVRNFQKMKEAEMRAMRASMEPWYQCRHLAWMDPGYTDGFHA